MACWIWILGSAYSSILDENEAMRYFQAFTNGLAISSAASRRHQSAAIEQSCALRPWCQVEGSASTDPRDNRGLALSRPQPHWLRRQPAQPQECRVLLAGTPDRDRQRPAAAARPTAGQVRRRSIRGVHWMAPC